MPCGRECPRHGRLGRRHPILELALLDRDLAEACERLEDPLLAGGLEVLRDRSLERRLAFILKTETDIQATFTWRQAWLPNGHRRLCRSGRPQAECLWMTALVSRNSLKAISPHSRPFPDIL